MEQTISIPCACDQHKKDYELAWDQLPIKQNLCSDLEKGVAHLVMAMLSCIKLS